MSTMALAWEQFRFERKLFWRNPSAAFFNFLLPLLLLFLTATAFSADGWPAARLPLSCCALHHASSPRCKRASSR